ncbi:hypothetical protein FKP32DRAFT_1679497 [Trametes sanguinea]|nr:hypothetical protein FKP32DRAFT_1679497 [Trametes sanguinea]
MYDRAHLASGAAPRAAPSTGLSSSSRDRLRKQLAARKAHGSDGSDLEGGDDAHGTPVTS